jgi:hypothetical protein
MSVPPSASAGQLFRLFGLGGLRVDLEVHHDLRAERLAQQDLALQHVAVRLGGERRVVEVLRADAEDDRPAVVSL